MGLTIPVEHINSIAQTVKQSKTFQSDRLKAVKAALIAYIDWSHEQSTNEAVELIQEVEQYATNKAVEFNNNMGEQLSNIFRTTEQNADQFTAQLISALSVSE
jgi:isopropylmalate/homocitrate/citramalate synthase